MEQARRALALGALTRAEYLLKRAAADPGIVEEEVIADLTRLAGLWQESGKSARAARLYAEVIERIEHLHGNDSPELLEPLRARASALLQSDLPHERACEPAEECLRQALKLQRWHGGGDMLDEGWILLDLADLVQDHERCEEGEELARQAWEVGRKYAWEDNALFFDAVEWLVWWYEAHAEWASGRELLDPSLALAKELMGYDHPRVAELMAAMANMLGQDEHFDEADELATRGLDILVRRYGDIPASSELWPAPAEELAQMRVLYSSLYSVRAQTAFVHDELRAARFFLHRALLLLDVPADELSSEGKASVATAYGTALHALAHVATVEGDEAQAERLFQRAIAQAEQGDSDRLASLLDDYANWLEDRGRDSDADKARREADDLRSQ